MTKELIGLGFSQKTTLLRLAQGHKLLETIDGNTRLYFLKGPKQQGMDMIANNVFSSLMERNLMKMISSQVIDGGTIKKYTIKGQYIKDVMKWTQLNKAN